MEDPVRDDILKLFRANPLLRDTPEVIASRIGRSTPDVEKALKQLESDGVVSVRWVGGAPLHFFTGSPGSEKTDRALLSGEPEETLESTVPPFTATIRVPSTLEGVHQARAGVESLCRSLEMDAGNSMEFAIALSEALTNAYRYGRRGDGRDVIRVDLSLEGSEIEVKIKDRGSGFPFLLIGASQGDGKSTGGRGLMLLRSLTDHLDIRRGAAGTVVTLRKRLKSAASKE